MKKDNEILDESLSLDIKGEIREAMVDLDKIGIRIKTLVGIGHGMSDLLSFYSKYDRSSKGIQANELIARWRKEFRQCL